jgi:hypothetical protein
VTLSKCSRRRTSRSTLVSRRWLASAAAEVEAAAATAEVVAGVVDAVDGLAATMRLSVATVAGRYRDC